MDKLEIEIKNSNSPLNGWTVVLEPPKHMVQDEHVTNWIHDWVKHLKNNNQWLVELPSGEMKMNNLQYMDFPDTDMVYSPHSIKIDKNGLYGKYGDDVGIKFKIPTALEIQEMCATKPEEIAIPAKTIGNISYPPITWKMLEIYVKNWPDAMLIPSVKEVVVTMDINDLIYNQNKKQNDE